MNFPLAFFSKSDYNADFGATAPDFIQKED